MAKKEEKVTKQELEKIRAIFEKEDTNKNKLGLGLVDKAIFMEETLKKLKKEIDAEGVVTEMCQGSYTIKRENPALKSYNGLIKNYISIIKLINDLLPVEEEKEEDPFDSFE